MGRAKLKMELIAKDKTRNTTYHKRKQGIIKKAHEFTILCDVDTAIIIYPPNSDTPEIWPENPNKIKKTIASYKAKKDETGKRSYNLHDFYEDRKKKIEDELVKARKKNMEAKYATWFDELDGLTELQLRQFAMRLENKENVVRAFLEFKKRNINFQLPFMFEVENKQPMVLNRGFDHIPMMNLNLNQNQHFMSHDPVWFGDNAPVKSEQLGFGYNFPVLDEGVVYDHNPNGQWGLQQPVVHGGVMPEFVLQRQELQVNNNGVGEFVMDDDDYFGRFMGGY